MVSRGTVLNERCIEMNTQHHMPDGSIWEDDEDEEDEEQEHCTFYQVQMDFLPPETPVECGACDWKGTYAEVEEIDECSLTPGDPSPAGRCPHPQCVGALVYVIKEVSHATPES